MNNFEEMYYLEDLIRDSKEEAFKIANKEFPSHNYNLMSNNSHRIFIDAFEQGAKYAFQKCKEKMDFKEDEWEDTWME